MGQARKADTTALRAEIEELRRAGLPLNRAELAARHGVSTTTVQNIRAQADRELAAGYGQPQRVTGHPGGRAVREFDGLALLRLRRARLLMQEELAVMSGVSRGEIGHLERGHRKPTLRTLRNLAAALEVDAGELLAVAAEGSDGSG